MKSCKDFEQEIYFYRELTKENKEVLDNHLTSCKQCREIFAIVQQTEALISKTASAKPEPVNSAQLTSNIMQRVGNQQKQNSSWINNMFLRSTMAAASLIIIIAFGVESFSPVGPLTKRYPYRRAATLNSASLTKSLLEKKGQTDKPSLYACLKSGECNTLIENFKKESL